MGRDEREEQGRGACAKWHYAIDRLRAVVVAAIVAADVAAAVVIIIIVDVVVATEYFALLHANSQS